MTELALAQQLTGAIKLERHAETFENRVLVVHEWTRLGSQQRSLESLAAWCYIGLGLQSQQKSLPTNHLPYMF